MKPKLFFVFAALTFLTAISPTQAAFVSCLDNFKSFSPLKPETHPISPNQNFGYVTAWYTNSRCILVGSATGLWLYDIDQPDTPLMLVQLTQLAVTTIAVNPLDSTIAFSVYEEPTMYLLHPDGTASTLSVSGQGITAISFSPDGSLIAVASVEIDTVMGFYNSSRVQIWDLSNQHQSEFSVGDISVVTEMFFTSDNQYLLTNNVRQGYTSSDLIYWDITNLSELWSYQDLLKSLSKWTSDDPLAPFTAIMNDHTVAVGGLYNYLNDDNYSGSEIDIWDAATQERKQQIVVFQRDDKTNGELMDMAFNSTGSEIVSSQIDGTIKLWNVADGKNVGEFDSGLKSPQVSFSPDDRFVAVQSSDQILIWDTTSQKTYTSLQLGSQGRHAGLPLQNSS